MRSRQRKCSGGDVGEHETAIPGGIIKQQFTAEPEFDSGALKDRCPVRFEDRPLDGADPAQNNIAIDDVQVAGDSYHGGTTPAGSRL